MNKDYIEVGQNLLEVRDPVNEIFFILQGSVDMYLNIQMQDVHLDTLHRGCTIGAYGVLVETQHKFIAKTNTPTSIVTLSKKTLKRLRKELRDLDESMRQAES